MPQGSVTLSFSMRHETKGSTLSVVGLKGFITQISFRKNFIMPYKPAKKLDDKDILKLQKEFLECDLDGDGKITREELKDVLRSLKGKMKVTEANIERVVKEADADSDGQIDLREYYHNMTNSDSKNVIHRALLMRSKARKAFEQYDTDGSGSITWDEMKEVFEERLGRKLDVKEVKEMMKETDENDDGMVDYNEFLTLMCKSV